MHSQGLAECCEGTCRSKAGIQQGQGLSACCCPAPTPHMWVVKNILRTQSPLLSFGYDANSLMIFSTDGTGTPVDTGGHTWTSRGVTTDGIFSMWSAPTTVAGSATITVGGSSATRRIDEIVGGSPFVIQSAVNLSHSPGVAVTLAAAPAATSLLIGAGMTFHPGPVNAWTQPAGWTQITANLYTGSTGVLQGGAYTAPPPGASSLWTLPITDLSFNWAGVLEVGV